MDAPPYVTVALIVANVIVYAITGVQSAPASARSATPRRAFSSTGNWPPDIHTHHEYYRLLTSGFLHVSVLHIFFNMLALGFIGPPLERLLGPWRFAAVYFLGLLGGSAAVYAFGNVLTAEVGASGAIFALFAACLVMVRRLPLDPQWLVRVIVLNFVFTFSVHNVSKLAHLGGFSRGRPRGPGDRRLAARRPTACSKIQLSGLGRGRSWSSPCARHVLTSARPGSEQTGSESIEAIRASGRRH